MITILVPKFTKQKSFYNKARIQIEGNEMKLISYETDIAIYNKYTNIFTMLCDYDKHLSNTTMKHLNDFRQQLGLDKLRKRDIFDKYYK